MLTIGLNRAVDLLADVKTKGRGGDTGKTVGDHPADGKPITLHSGRYGPYLRHGKLLASVPKSMDADGLTVDQAVEVLAAQAEKKGTKSGKKAGGTANGTAKPKAKAKAKTKAKTKSKAKAKTAGRKTATATAGAESEG